MALGLGPRKVQVQILPRRPIFVGMAPAATAPRLHRGFHRFESCYPHHFYEHAKDDTDLQIR